MAVVSHKSVISPVLVGRQSDLDVLAALLEESGQGHGQLALLVGEAGIGKSRLAAELKRRAGAAGFWTLQGHCVEPDHLIPYSPLLEILRNHVSDPAAGDVMQRLGPPAAILAKLFPELGWPSGELQSTPAPEQEKRLLHHGLTRYLLELASQRPLLLIVEDLHWSDDATLEFLLYLVRRLVDQSILLLLTYRGDEIGPGLSRFIVEVERQRLAVELVLAPLTQRQIDEMMRAIFDLARPIRHEFLQAVAELTEGNPFFIEEVLKALLAVGDIYYGENSWDRRPLDELRIPRSVADAVRRRAAGLSAPAQQLLALAAVAGRRFDVALLQEVTQLDEQTLLAALKELIAAQLIVETGIKGLKSEGNDEFAFRHALIQHALYSNQLGRERQAMHRALAQTLVQRNADRLDGVLPELAYHTYAGGAWAEALLYARRAGDQAQQLYLPQAALKQYSRALEAAAHLPGVPAHELAAIHRARGLAYEMVGNFDPALTDLQAALAVVRAQPDRPALAALEWQLLIDLGFLWAARDYRRTGEYYQQALALAQQLEEPAVLAHSYNRVGNWQLNRGDPHAALDAYHQALPIFEMLQDQQGLAQTYDLMGMASCHIGDPNCIAYYDQAVTLLRQLDDRVGLISVLAMLGPLRTLLGLAQNAEEAATQTLAEVTEALELARRIDFQSGEVFVLCQYAQVCDWWGDFHNALAYASHALTLAQEIEHYQWLGAAQITLGGIYLDLMAYEAARPHLQAAVAMAQEVNSHIFVCLACGVLALLYLEEGDLERAEATVASVKLDAPVSYYEHLFWIARLQLALRRNEPALVLQLFALCRSPFSDDDKANWIALSLRLSLGQALAALGDPQAEAVLRGVCEVAQGGGLRPLLLWARIEYGRLLTSKRRLDEAEREFAAARALVKKMAATVENAELADQFHRRALARIPMPAGTPRQAAKRAFDGLTAAEQQVATLVAQGKSNREIAVLQVVSIKTVEAHINHILSKLGFTSRAQIAVWAVEKGLAAGSSTSKDPK